METKIREPKFIAFDNGWDDGRAGRSLGESPWCSSPVIAEAMAYWKGWRAGMAGWEGGRHLEPSNGRASMKQWISDYIPRKTSRQHNFRALCIWVYAAILLGVVWMVGR